MWELVESIIMYSRHKKWPLPLFIVFLLIITTFAWSTVDPSQVAEQRSTHPKIAITPLPSPTPKPSPQIRTKKIKEVVKITTKEVPVPTPVPTGNVTHFQYALLDALKVEGLNSEVAEKIFSHMRAALDKPVGTYYELADSVRAAMPDASDEEVYRIRDIVSNTATESSER